MRPLAVSARVATQRPPGPGRRGSSASSALTSTKFRRSEEHTSELQSQSNLVCRLLLEKKKKACLFLKDCLGNILYRKESYEHKIVKKWGHSQDSFGCKVLSSLRVPEQLNASHPLAPL